MIENRKPAVTFKGDGSTTVFPFSFALVEANDLYVSIYDMATGTATELTRDYYVDMAGKAVHYPGYAPGQEPAGHDRPPALPAGKTITLYRRTDIDQRTDLGEKYPLPYIEKMSDKATAIMQELEEQIGRSVKVALGDPKTPTERLTELQTYVSDAKASAQSAGASERSAEESKRSAADSARSAAVSQKAAAENQQAAQEAQRGAERAMDSAGRSASAAASAESGSEEALRHVKRLEEYMQSVGAEMDGYVGIAVRTVADRIRAVLSEEYVPWGTSIVGGKVDWNTLTEECCYKIQGCEMSDACHAPVGEYAFGMLVVHRLKRGADNDNRTVQEYHPHITAGAVHIRMRNQAGWTPWCKYASKNTIDDALKDKVSKSGDIMSGDLNLGKGLHFTGGGTSAGIWPGQKDTGDPISAQDANLVIGSWYGIAFYDQCYNRVMCGLDVRSGTFRTLGQIEAKAGFVGQLIGKADSAGHSDTSKSADDANKLGGKPLSDILDKINAQNTGGVVASSITQNGWVRFANGLIIQWGTIDGLSAVDKAYAFPIEFPAQAFMITGASISHEYGVTLKAFSKAQFTASWWPGELGSAPQNGHPVQFIAIGH